MRRPCCKLVILLTLLLAAVYSGAQQTKPVAAAPTAAAMDVDAETTFSLIAERQPITALDGLWRFQPGDDPRWSDAHFDDSRWALVQSHDYWDESGFNGLSGMAWYRFRVVLPPGEEAFTLRLPQIPTCYQVFADGKLLLTLGKLPPQPVMFRSQPLLIDLPEEPRSGPKTITFAIRIWHAPEWSRYMLGGLHGPALIGRSDLMHAQFEKETSAHLWNLSDWFDLGILDLLAFLIALALFFSRRAEIEYLWFSLMVLGSGGNHLVRAWDNLYPNPVKAMEGIENFFFALFLASSLLFYRSFLGGRWTILFRLALGCSALWYLGSIMIGPGLLTVTEENFCELIFSLPVYLWTLLFIRRRAYQQSPYARLLIFPVLLLVGSLYYRQIVWTLQTAGLPIVNHLYLEIRKPFFVTMEDVAEGFFLLAMLGIVLYRFARTRREQDRIASELEAARSVQQVLVPESLPSVHGLEIAMAYYPALEVGGDFFQILPLSSGDTMLVIGDVAGKGLSAALTVSLAVGSIRTLVDYTDSPAALLARLNRRMQGRGPGFTTCLALRFSADRSVLTIANAGHLPPYVNGFELQTEPHLPLGLDPQATFSESRYALKPGDHLVVLTDGVPEAQHHGELFGFERTIMLSREPAARIAEAARLFGQTDDITVLTVDVISVPISQTAQPEPAFLPV